MVLQLNQLSSLMKLHYAAESSGGKKRCQVSIYVLSNGKLTNITLKGKKRIIKRQCNVRNVSTHRHQEFLLLFLLLLGLLTYGLVFLLHLFQCADLHLLEVVHLLLIVGSQPGELLLITLVLLTQRLWRRKAVCSVGCFPTLNRDR